MSIVQKVAKWWPKAEETIECIMFGVTWEECRKEAVAVAAVGVFAIILGLIFLPGWGAKLIATICLAVTFIVAGHLSH